MKLKSLLRYAIAGMMTVLSAAAFNAGAATAGAKFEAAMPGVPSGLKPGTFTYTVNPDGTTCTLSKMNFSTTGVQPADVRVGFTITVPSTVTYGEETLTVTAIGNSVTSGMAYVKKLVFPETVKNIGNSCFQGCRDLEAIDFGGVEVIGSSCFYHASSDYQQKLISVDLSKVKVIGNNSFSGFPNLKKVELCPELESLGTGTFSDCPKADFSLPENSTHEIIGDVIYLKDADRLNPVKLMKVLPTFTATTLTLPSTVTDMAASSFRDCKTIESIDLGGNLTAIPNQAFWGCSALKEVKGTENVENIGYYAFYNCTALTEFNVGAKVNSIGLVWPGDAANTPGNRSAFLGCSALTEFTVDEGNAVYAAEGGALFNKDRTELLSYVANTGKSYEVPAGVRSVSDFAFASQNNIEQLTIGNDVENIGGMLFASYNKTLHELNIGANVKEIGARAFQNAQSVSTIACYAAVPPVITVDPDYCFYTSVYREAQLVTPDAAAYKSAAGWSKFTNSTTGVEAVEAEAAEGAVEWYNLQGVRVENPQSGLYIRRQGNKVEKVAVK